MPKQGEMNPSAAYAQGMAAIAEAEKSPSTWGFFNNPKKQYLKALALMKVAAIEFSKQNMKKEAGDAYKQVALLQLHHNIGEDQEPEIEPLKALDEAYKEYRQVEPESAAECLKLIVERHRAKPEFHRAANVMQKLAELYELEIGDNGRAAAAYEEAATWFERENSAALSNKLWLKAADLVAMEGKDYYKAITLYEKVAKASVNNNLMRWSIKEYLLKAGICQLCTGDQVGTNIALEKYRELDPSFSQQREHQLLVDLAQAVESGDQEAFSEKLFQYDQLSKLDKWKTTLLLRVKNAVENQEEDFS